MFDIANEIVDLSGLNRHNLPSLRLLDLHNNKISSTKNISLPTLRQLYLASNEISEIEGLDGLPQLTTLHLRENQISQLDGLTEHLVSLQYINFRYMYKYIVYIHVHDFCTSLIIRILL